MGENNIHSIEQDEVTVKESILYIQRWVRYLWTKKWLLLVAGALGGALGLWYTFSKNPVYTATTTFVIESSDSKSGLGALSGMAAMAGIDLGGGAGGLFQGDNIPELYKSRRMLVQALLTKVHADSNELLVERYLDITGQKASWEERPELLALDFRQDPTKLNPQTRRLQDSVMTALTNTIRSEVLAVDKPDRKLSIVQVNVTSPDEVFSKAFNESIVKRVNEFYIQTKTKKFTDNIAILQQKVDSVRAVMTGAIYSVARASDATPNLNPTRQVQRIAPAQEAQFSAEANRTILAQLLQNLELTKMNLLQEQPLIQLIDQPVYPLKAERLSKIKGIIIGGFLLGFLTLLCLIAIRYYNEIMAEGEGGDNKR